MLLFEYWPLKVKCKNFFCVFFFVLGTQHNNTNSRRLFRFEARDIEVDSHMQTINTVTSYLRRDRLAHYCLTILAVFHSFYTQISLVLSFSPFKMQENPYSISIFASLKFNDEVENIDLHSTELSGSFKYLAYIKFDYLFLI